jgi:glucan-binding YG repeat protein
LAQGEFVEPVQLQVVCYQLWERLHLAGALAGVQSLITDQSLELVVGQRRLADFVNQALGDYYEQALRGVLRTPGVDVNERELRDWFSNELLTSDGTRGMVFQGSHVTGGLPNPVVQLLADQFLIRAEQRSGGTWYELVHDRFVQPIVDANHSWVAEQTDPVTTATRVWLRSQRDPTRLLKGSLLTDAERYARENPRALGEDERAFLEASAALQATARQAAIRRSFAGLLAFVGLVVLLLMFALWQFQAATVAQDDAKKAQAEALQQREAAQAASLEADRLRRDAVQAQADAQQLRGAAQAATLEASAAKADAELRRVDAEDAQSRAATSRAEAERAQAQADAALADLARVDLGVRAAIVDADKSHAAADAAQATAQAAEAQAEQQRQAAEQARADAVAAQTAAEQARQSAVQAETRAVAAQAQAEQERRAAEEAKAQAATERSYADVYLQKLVEAQAAAQPESTPEAGACASPVELGFGQLWRTENGVRSRLGCPLARQESGIAGTQYFLPNGMMYWWDPEFVIYVLYGQDSGRWERYVLGPDNGESLPYTCPTGTFRPERGFGRFLATHKAVLDRLGNCATAAEEGPKEANNEIGARQFFENGLTVFMPLTRYTQQKRIWVMVDDGSHTAGTYTRHADLTP